MKKNILILVVFLFTNILTAQCDDYSQLLTAGIKKIFFFDSNNGFAFGQGTLIKTNDGGVNWSFVEIPNNSFYSETLKYCDQIDENSAIIVGQGGTMLKTINKGQTWSTLSLMIDGQENINNIDFIDDSIGYATAYTNSTQQSYLMKTTNGGLSWTKNSIGFHNALNSSLNFYDNIGICFLDEMSGFAWNGIYLFKTIDGGLTWSQVQNPDSSSSNPMQISMMKIAENQNIVISLVNSESHFYVSSDAGDNWTLISSLSPSNNVFIDSSFFCIKNNKISMIGRIGTTNIKSYVKYDLTNNTFTSNLINNITLGIQSDIFFYDELDGYIIDRGNVFWLDTPGRKILKTNNNGVNWNEIDSFSLINPNSQNNFKVLKNSLDTLTLTKQDNYNGWNYDFNLYVSTNNGTTWQQKLNLTATTAILLKATGNYISYIRNTNPFNGADGLSLYESFDLGNTWSHSEFMGPVNIILESYIQLDYDTLRCGFNNEMFLSFDKGQTWMTVPMPTVANVNFNKTEIKSVNEIYVWGLYNNWPTNYDYYLYKTLDQGQSWQQVVTIPDNNGVDLGVIADTTVFGSNFAFVSTGGNTYYNINLNNNTFAPIAFMNPNPSQVYVGNENLKILNDTTWLMNTSNGYKTTINQGQTWVTKKCLVCSNKIIYDDTTNDFISYDSYHGVERIKDYLLPIPIIYGDAVVELNHIGNYFVPNNSLAIPVWDSVIGGTSTLINNNYIQINWTQIGEQIVRVKYINNCGETEFVEFTVTVIPELSIENYETDKVIVFPNPFTDDIYIHNNNFSKSDIKIYNINGQLIFSNTYDNQEINITNLENLNSGTYFVVIKIDNKITTKKLIKN